MSGIGAGAAPVSIATAQNDEHELELIASWCRAELERDPGRRLLIVDAKLRQRRGQYERLLSQTLSPSEWVAPAARSASTVFAIEGGRPLAGFPAHRARVAHAAAADRAIAIRRGGALAAHAVPRRRATCIAGAAIEALPARGTQARIHGARSWPRFSSAPAAPHRPRSRRACARRLATLAGQRRTPAEWAPRLLAALRQLGWHGARPLRSDEQQTVNRWHALLDEYSALGPWLPRSDRVRGRGHARATWPANATSTRPASRRR